MASKSPILHAYRHLLRAASYLPDSLSRLRIHNEIVKRFRKHQSRPATAKTLHTTLSYTTKLNRAAALHRKDLEAILNLTYGRTGVRRRVLMKDLRSTSDLDVPSDEMSLQEFINMLEEKSKKEGRTENAKVKALMKSQKENQAQSDKARLKFLEPQIPKENIWGRPTPVKLRRNLESRWWAETLPKLAPPVEGEEWGRLRDLAKGILVEDAPVRRATKVALPEDEREFMIEDVTQRVTNSQERYDIVSKRGLRRLYSVIWAQTPIMTWDSVRMKWETQWGSEYPISKSGVDAVPRATGSEMELFEGVDELRAKIMEENSARKKGGKRGKNMERIKAIE